MLTLKQARDRRAALKAETDSALARANSEGRPLTAEELKADDDRFAEWNDIGAQLVVLERQQEQEQALITERGRNGAVDPNAAAQDRSAGDGGIGTGKKVFASLGEQLKAIYQVATPGYRGNELERLSLVGVASGMSEGVPSEGGFLLQPEYAAGLLSRTYEIGAISSRVRRIPIGPNSNTLRINAVDERSRVDGSRWGGVLAYWTNEADAKTGSKPKFRQMELALQKLTALCYVTDELLQDAVALESVLNQAFPEELNFRVEDAIFEGTGAGQPLGIINSPSVIPVAAEAGQVGATFVWENVVKMWARMWARSRANSVWLINQDVEPALMTMSQKIGTAGVPVYLPPGGATAAPYASLMGRPVIPVEYCSTLGTIGDVVLCDLDQYLMIDKGGIQSASSIHVRFIYDESTFRFVYRVDGQPIWNAALTPFKGANSLSPFIVLASR